MSKIGNNSWAQNCSQYLNFFRLSELCLLLMKPLYLILLEDTTLGNGLCFMIFPPITSQPTCP